MPPHAEGPHTIRVEAGSSAGAATPVTLPFRADRQRPRISLSAPAEGATLFNKVQISGVIEETYPSALVSDAWTLTIQGPDGYQLVVKPGDPRASNDKHKVEYSWLLTGLKAGEYTLALDSTDMTGHVGYTVRRKVYVYNNAPEITITAPTGGQMVNKANMPKLTITGKVKTEDKDTAVTVFVDGVGQTVNVTKVADGLDFTCDWDVTDNVEANRVVLVKAETTTHLKAELTRNFRHDCKAPRLTLENPGSPKSGVVNLNGTVEDLFLQTPVAAAWMLEITGPDGKTRGIKPGDTGTDGSTQNVVKYAWDTTKTADGTYSLQLKATDKGANPAATTSIMVEVYNTTPTVKITSPTQGQVIHRVDTSGGTSASETMDITGTVAGIQASGTVVTVYVGGTEVKPVTVNWGQNPATFKATWTIPDGTELTHTVRAEARNSTGKTHSDSLNFDTDRMKPRVAITQPSDTYVGTTFNVAATVEDMHYVPDGQQTANGPSTVKVEVGDEPVTVEKPDWKLTGKVWAFTGEVVTGKGSANKRVRVTLLGKDAGVNSQTITRETATIMVTPEVKLTLVSGGYVADDNGDQVRTNVVSDPLAQTPHPDAGKTLYVKGADITLLGSMQYHSSATLKDSKHRDETVANPGTGPQTANWTHTEVGLHTLTLTAMNLKGLTSEPARLNVVLDRKEPSLAIVSPVAGFVAPPGSVLTLIFEAKNESGGADQWAPLKKVSLNVDAPAVTVAGLPAWGESYSLMKAVTNPDLSSPNGAATVTSLGGNAINGYRIVWQLPILPTYKGRPVYRVGQNYTITLSGLEDIVKNASTTSPSVTFRVGIN
jgi:hypothetical protein